MRHPYGAPARVGVYSLKLSAYRNYPSFAVEFTGRHVVFTGHNGAGKTNLLEALSFLAPGRGLRRVPYADLIAHGTTGPATIFARLQSPLYDEVNLGVAWQNDEASRIVRINGASSSVDGLADYCRIISLTPAMDGLFTGPASERRRFLDRLVYTVDPQHGRRVTDYEKAMRARNRLFRERKGDARWFEGIEVQIATLGVAIAAARLDLWRHFDQLLKNLPYSEAFPRVSLRLEGELESALTTAPALEVEEAFMHRLARERHLEGFYGSVMQGPHRSDLLVYYADKNMPAAHCSTGEQKALLTGLILAYAVLIENLVGFTPLLLLDEVAAHFDPSRRGALFTVLDELGAQAFMTGTDPYLFGALEGQADFFEIKAGEALAR